MTTLEDLTTVLQHVEATAGPAVVGVGHHRGVGSGIVIAGGIVLTNAHNLRGDTVGVRLHDGQPLEASVVAADPDDDLAVLAVDTGDITPLAWTDNGAPQVGTAVFGLSRPRSGSSVRVTFGTVAATQRRFRGPRSRPIAGAFEHTAPLARGASGGPVVDAEGRLLGVNTHRMGDGFYLAVPADATLRERVDALSAGRAPRHRQLGVALAPPRVARRLRAAVGLPERDGLLVQQVFDDTPAAAADLRRGDLIVTVNDAPADSVDVLYAALAANADRLTLRLVRGTDEIETLVRFED
ncbi:MAG TPA: trypsin-like peptidase domain-containing protein [Euzebyales bacterium]|nr:trypsin-like peptidase domain-containing protein [Euzebyales bacterium]